MPNISGNIEYSVGVISDNQNALFNIAFRSGAVQAGIGSGFPQTIISFDASKFSTLYSSISTVQPISLRVLNICRI